MRMPRGLHRVDGGLAIAVRAVLESHRHRKPAGHLAVRLAFGRARADGRPTHQIGDVLRHDRIEDFRGRRQTQRRNIQQQPPPTCKPRLDVAAIVDVRIVDQPLPADRRARFFEIHAHENLQLAREFLAQFGQSVRVVHRARGVMDGARPDDDEHALVASGKNIFHRRTAGEHDLGGLRGERQTGLERGRGNQTLRGEDPAVLDRYHGGWLWVVGYRLIVIGCRLLGSRDGG